MDSLVKNALPLGACRAEAIAKIKTIENFINEKKERPEI